MKKPVINAFLFLMVLGALLLFLYTGKRAKQKWIVYKTLQSAHWKERTIEIEKELPGKYKIIFLGNSLTELFDLPYYFKDSTILNCGIVGDFTEGVLKRIEIINKLQPQLLFIEIGINDIVEQVPQEEVLRNYNELINAIKVSSPNTRIYVQNNLPVIIRKPSLFVSNKTVNDRIVEQNLALRELAKRNEVMYIDLYSAFMRSGTVEDLVVEDGIHLTPKAYATWKRAVEYLFYQSER